MRKWKKGRYVWKVEKNHDDERCRELSIEVRAEQIETFVERSLLTFDGSRTLVGPFSEDTRNGYWTLDGFVCTGTEGGEFNDEVWNALAKYRVARLVVSYLRGSRGMVFESGLSYEDLSGAGGKIVPAVYGLGPSEIQEVTETILCSEQQALGYRKICTALYQTRWGVEHEYSADPDYLAINHPKRTGRVCSSPRGRCRIFERTYCAAPRRLTILLLRSTLPA